MSSMLYKKITTMMISTHYVTKGGLPQWIGSIYIETRDDNY